MPITFLETVTAEKLLEALSTASDLDKAKLALALLTSMSPNALSGSKVLLPIDALIQKLEQE